MHSAFGGEVWWRERREEGRVRRGKEGRGGQEEGKGGEGEKGR